METSKVGYWLQISQNSELMKEQLDNTYWTDQLNLQLTLMGDDPTAAVAKAMESPSDLTLEETRILDAYLHYWSLQEVRELILYRRGMSVRPPSGYTSDDPAFNLHRRLLGNAYFKARFEATGLGPELTPKVEELVLYSAMKRWRNTLP